jgi:GT2 family glycosyltransferase
MRTAVITIVAGRYEHLARQRAALDTSVHHVVVAMGDGEVDRCRATPMQTASDVIGVDSQPLGLPLAHARNAGARRALAAGAELLVFLDVDCVPGPALLRRYGKAAAGDGAHSLLCGPVGYLPPAPAGGYPSTGLGPLARPHPARPVPPEHALLPSDDHALFWTLSFAVTTGTWARIGEFCEQYVGYGGEDTDYGQLARRAGVGVCWVGGAWAYHQHHATERPPVQHRDDILRNAALFHRRWGWWPMLGWLTAFEQLGLACFDSATSRWTAAGVLDNPSGGATTSTTTIQKY